MKDLCEERHLKLLSLSTWREELKMKTKWEEFHTIQNIMDERVMNHFKEITLEKFQGCFARETILNASHNDFFF